MSGDRIGLETKTSGNRILKKYSPNNLVTDLYRYKPSELGGALGGSYLAGRDVALIFIECSGSNNYPVKQVF